MFLVAVIQVDMERSLVLVCICTPLMTNDVRHLLMGSVAVCLFSLERCLLKSYTDFLPGLVFSLSSCKSPIYILDTRHLSDM